MAKDTQAAIEREMTLSARLDGEACAGSSRTPGDPSGADGQLVAVWRRLDAAVRDLPVPVPVDRRWMDKAALRAAIDTEMGWGAAVADAVRALPVPDVSERWPARDELSTAIGAESREMTRLDDACRNLSVPVPDAERWQAIGARLKQLAPSDDGVSRAVRDLPIPEASRSEWASARAPIQAEMNRTPTDVPAVPDSRWEAMWEAIASRMDRAPAGERTDSPTAEPTADPASIPLRNARSSVSKQVIDASKRFRRMGVSVAAVAAAAWITLVIVPRFFQKTPSPAKPVAVAETRLIETGDPGPGVTTSDPKLVDTTFGKVVLLNYVVVKQPDAVTPVLEDVGDSVPGVTMESTGDPDSADAPRVLIYTVHPIPPEMKTGAKTPVRADKPARSGTEGVR